MFNLKLHETQSINKDYRTNSMKTLILLFKAPFFKYKCIQKQYCRLLSNNDIILLSNGGEVVKEGLKDCVHT